VYAAVVTRIICHLLCLIISLFFLSFCSVLLCSVLVCCYRSISSAPVFPVLDFSSLRLCAPTLSHHILSYCMTDVHNSESIHD
jgi:hypothetical protein